MIDEDDFFSGVVSTSPLLGVGEILLEDYPTGRHKLTVWVNNITISKKFKHKNDQYIYIAFDKASSKITITFPDEKYLYD